MASALNDVTREFGTALGVALLGALLSAGYRSAVDDRLSGIPGDAADTVREGGRSRTPGDGPGRQSRDSSGTDGSASASGSCC